MPKSKLEIGKALTGILSRAADFAMSEDGQKFICGTYSNGKPRSLADAARDEFISPKDREDWEKKKKKKKKKNKKAKKKAKKKIEKVSSDFWIGTF